MAQQKSLSEQLNVLNCYKCTTPAVISVKHWYFCVFSDAKKGSCDSWWAKHAHSSAHAHTLSLIQAVNCSLLRCPLSWRAGLVALILQRRLRQWKLGYGAAVVLTEQASLGGDKDSNWLGLNESEEGDWLPSIHFFLQWAPPSLIMTTLRPIKCVWAVMGEIPLRGISSICKGCNYERMWGTKVNLQQVPSGWIIIIGLPLASHCNLVIWIIGNGEDGVFNVCVCVCSSEDARCIINVSIIMAWGQENSKLWWNTIIFDAD